ncbi:MAG: GDYXXLXY domain-containing protein [Psychrobacter sp.]|uniref:GDYXXLXY domain-containing protein n=1 Tax=Psychrobacter sp. AOP7-B1-24 TaxID=3457645 RepID=UPI003FB84B93
MIDNKSSLVVRHPTMTPQPWWQKRAFKIGIALLGLLLVITTMTINVAKFETHLAMGNTVLLKLAPIDPRGFMQGDYMTLNYDLESDVFDALPPDSASRETEAQRFEQNFRKYDPKEGYVIVKTDNHNIGQFVRLADNQPDDLAANEMAIYYRARNGRIKLATNAYFFQEGHAESFEAAKYGLFRVNDKGEPLLTHMVNQQFKIIRGVNNHHARE